MDQLPFLIPYILSLAIITGVGIFTWQRRQVTGAIPFVIVTASQASMTLGYIFELASHTLEAKIFWDDFQWIGTVLMPAAMLVFALDYSGRKPDRLRIWGLVLALPAIFLFLVATNRWHGLTRGTSTLLPGEPFSVLVYDFTPLVYAISVYIYGAILTAFYFLARLFIRAQRIYRAQVAAIILGTIVPLAGGLLALANITLTFQRDMTPLTLAIGNLFFAWGLFRYRLFDVTPVAWETAVAHMRDAVIVLDAENRVVDINPTGRALLPAKEGRVIGLPVTQFLAEWVTTVKKFLDVEQANEEIAFGQGEQRRYFELDIMPIYSRQKKLGRIIVLHDITARKRAEEQLRQRSADLEAVNRYLQEARQTAEEAQREAEEANRVKSKFLASMSHELRTPLNAIINFTEMITLEMIGPVSDKQKELLNQSLSSSNHLLHLINDILDISKIQAGKLALFIEDDVDLRQELKTVIDMTVPLLNDKPVELVQDIDADLPLLAGDKRRIRQVVLNLLSNAAKFTPEGSITLSVQKRGDHILLTVTDTGPGISAEMQEFIFEPFVQTKEGLKHAQGTGLGLPIARSLVEAHGGKLWLESERGEGAAFYVTLPVDGIKKS